MEKLHLILAITDRSRAEQAIGLLRENHVFATDVALGEGTAPEEILDYLYLRPNEKAVIIGVITAAGLPSLLRSFKRKMYIDMPGNGIVVTVPLASVGGKRSLEYILDGQTLNLLERDRRSVQVAEAAAQETEPEAAEREKEAERMEDTGVNTEYELIFVVANEGYTDLVMDAARAGGAKGGTVIKAKGTGGEYTEKFFGFSLAAEKEIVLIVAKTEERSQIMKSIMKGAGLDSKAKSLTFSLPVSHAIGLRVPE